MPGYDLSDTIAAIATPPGSGAIGILRLSGADSHRLARELASGLPQPAEAQRAYVVQVPLDDAGGAAALSDTAVCILWRGPRSYTGEDGAELLLHGSPALLRLVLERALALGARAALPGEFTYRAYLHERLDLAQAEAVGQLIAAGSAHALRLAAAQLAGLPGRRIEGWLARLTELLAGIEVIHDYAADDLDASLDPAQLLTAEKLDAALARLEAEMDAALAQAARTAPLREGLSVALLGPPNVGKSTLFNALLGHERSLTAAEPGTTRDYVTADLAAAGVRLSLVDTAGWRAAAEPVEAEGVERSAQWGAAADHVLWVTAADSPSVEPPPDLAGRALIRVVTRCDLLPQWPAETAAAHHVSGATGRGVDSLREALAELPVALGEPALDALGRLQAEAAGLARASLTQARAALAAGLALDAAAADLYDALEHLRGSFAQHDRHGVVEAVFSGFCVGK